MATPLPTASLSCLLGLCKRGGRAIAILNFFYVICFSASNQLDMISELNIKFVSSLQEFGLLEVRWEGR